MFFQTFNQITFAKNVIVLKFDKLIELIYRVELNLKVSNNMVDQPTFPKMTYGKVNIVLKFY